MGFIGSVNESLMPQRGNLVAECRRVILLRIAGGEWGKSLPGERRLADLLHVGRDTIRLALKQLEAERLIGVADGGRRRKVFPEAVAAAVGKVDDRQDGQALRIGMLSPFRLERLPQSMLIEVDQVRQALAAKNSTLELHAPGWYESARPGRYLPEFLEGSKCTAWILYRAREEVQAAFESAGVPCLVRGYPLDASRLPHIDADWRAIARHAAARLWRVGHRRVGIVIAADFLAGVNAAVRGVMEFDGSDYLPVEIREDGSRDGLVRALSRVLRGGSPPTALVTTRPRQAATILTWLMSRGFRLPDHFSLIALGREPFLEHLAPQISGYAFDPTAVARLVIRRLERIVASGAGAALDSPWLTPEEIAGETVGPPSE
jgi:DNA-binding LacI/PurR family transcriptional regulator